jgi:hypothetical protein
MKTLFLAAFGLVYSFFSSSHSRVCVLGLCWRSGGDWPVVMIEHSFHDYLSFVTYLTESFSIGAQVIGKLGFVCSCCLLPCCGRVRIGFVCVVHYS